MSETPDTGNDSQYQERQDSEGPARGKGDKFIDRHLWHVQPVRDVLTGLGILALLWLGQKISVVTVPLLLAILLAYLFEPVIQFLMRRLKIGRTGAVGGLIAAVVLFVLVPAVLALSYGLAQAITFVGNTADNIRLVSESVAQDPGRQEQFISRHYRDEFAASLQESQQAASDSAPEDGTPATEGLPGPPPIEPTTEQKMQLAAENILPQTWMWVRDRVFEARDEGDTTFGRVFDAIDEWVKTNTKEIAQAAAGTGMDVLRSVGGFLGTAIGIGFTLFLTLFFFFFVSTGWVKLKGFGESLLPDRYREETLDLLTKFDRVISGFVRGRLTIAFLQAIVFSIAYWAIGVPAAFILGPIIAILSIVPYAALIGLPISIGLLFLEGHEGFRGAWWWVLGAPVAVYFIGQALDDYVWTPMIQGKETGMDTPTILFASLAGGALFGVFGLLIAIPLAACAKILIQELFWPKFKEWAEGRRADALPID